MILAEGLSRTYGTFVAVDSLDFHIPRGQVVGFLGPNGAGKTTTLRMITGYLTPSAGSVRVGGHDVTAAPRQARRLLGYLPETAPSYGEMRVTEYLRFRAGLFGVGRTRRRAAIDRVLSSCGLREMSRRPIDHLSRGYRQRVGLAAALLHDPPLLVLDEPTVGLDPTQIREVRTLVRALAGEHTVLLSTHILPEVEQVCDRILLIAGGQVRAQGTVEEIRRGFGSAHRYVVEVRAASVPKALSDLPEVADIASEALDGGWIRITLSVRPETADLRETIAAALERLGATPRELTCETPTLEQIFVDMVSRASRGRDDRTGAR